MSSSSKALRGVFVQENYLKQKSYTYHAHDYREVLTLLGANEDGFFEPEVIKRRKKYGGNVFTKEKKTYLVQNIYTQLRSPLTFVLILASVITIVLKEYIDASVIVFALLIAVIVGLLQEGKASRAFQKLANSQTHYATVIRGKKKVQILAEELVVGDIVVLQSGAKVPADIRLIRAKQLAINEATLTGEWRAVDKQTKAVPVGTPFAEQASMAWMGTYIAEGYGMGVVTAIGDFTAIGKLASDVRDVVEVRTPLQDEMARVSRIMLYIISILVGIIFIIGLVQGQSLEEVLLISIAIAVASVPEGLPAAVTIILAVGMEALLKRGGLVRNLLAAETLGSTTYVLTDKTGTLTEAKMEIVGAILGDGKYIKDTDFSDNKKTREMFSVALAGIDAYTDRSRHTPVVRGDSVERAILIQADEIGMTEEKSVHRRERIDYLAFTSEQRFAAGLSEVDDEAFVLSVNGAPNYLLAHAGRFVSSQGEEVFTDSQKDYIQTAINNQTEEGKRLVAVGYKQVSYDDIPEHDKELLNDLVFAGVVVLDDPVRKGVKEAIRGVQNAGAEVILITGDNPQTAFSVAQRVGIVGVHDGVLTGKDLERLSDEEILLALEHVKVFARILPEQKMRIAMVLQQKGEIVAMTGDGINDAPALRRANIGIAIGSGTEVAKESSDLVLVEDSFATIYSAIEEGRRITANLRKVVGYLLSTSLSEVVLIGAALLAGSAVPILPAQILWANVIEEGLMSVAFAFEKGEKGAMKRRPQDIHMEGILSRDTLWFLAFVVTVLSMLTLALYFYVRSLELPIEIVRSVMFLSISMDSLFMSFAFRSLSVPIWRIPISSNLFFLGSFVLSVGLLAIVLTIPFFQYLLSYTPLSLNMIALVVAFSSASLVAIEFAKWVYFERKT